ncbi:hypothetical protein BDW72DRAFT_206168 [Aspergillus terricola var. indicus]
MASNTTSACTLKLSPVLPPDIPALATHDLHSKSFQKYVKIVDSSARGEHDQKHERLIAYAKWDLSTPEERGSRYPLWHRDMPAAECEVFFEMEERERRRFMEGLRHYCMRRGAGSMLLQWGCNLADEEGVALYVDASRAGAPLYERFGFVDESKGDPGEGGVASMVRRARRF